MIEHLFKVTAARKIQRSGEDIYEVLENSIQDIEKKNRKSIHILAKHMFFYGDYEGNRTPFADSQMRGSFIGESTDTSILNLTYKYVSMLEFLSFQTKLIIDTFQGQNSGARIEELRVSGSQAKNGRLLSLISLVNDGIKIKRPNENIDLMGVMGAYMLGKSANEKKQIIDIIRERDANADSEEFEPFGTYQLGNDCILLKRLLSVKYRIHLDMAKQQQQYHRLVDEALNVTN